MARKIYDDPLNIDTKTWLTILGNDKITDPKTLEILTFLFYSDNYEERGGIIAKKLKYSHHAACNGIIKSFGKRIEDNYPKYKYPADRFHVPFLGEAKNGGFYWKLRPELAEALKRYGAE